MFGQIYNRNDDRPAVFDHVAETTFANSFNLCKIFVYVSKRWRSGRVNSS